MKYFALIHGKMVRLTEVQFNDERITQLTKYGRAFVINEMIDVQVRIILQSSTVTAMDYKKA